MSNYFDLLLADVRFATNYSQSKRTSEHTSDGMACPQHVRYAAKRSNGTIPWRAIAKLYTRAESGSFRVASVVYGNWLLPLAQPHTLLWRVCYCLILFAAFWRMRSATITNSWFTTAIQRALVTSAIFVAKVSIKQAICRSISAHITRMIRANGPKRSRTKVKCARFVVCGWAAGIA